ncbi:hypothetical protein BCR32DRAFT_251208 [Anaeromyces robustus]|uniref:Uncharacterized protein n=1 Tax=Anaeromyces robustus TaxID=1754192 RepID=A0A1Y1VTC4_9FUNG|nr:hypothetical protein BCR32DRAFT_251208 [Anaeromyces robustus]|eukprot:ORX64266.1 hypothetical protein BCR32DRAFT_251208 [Anaeromyces robustus]
MYYKPQENKIYFYDGGGRSEYWPYSLSEMIWETVWVMINKKSQDIFRFDPNTRNLETKELKKESRVFCRYNYEGITEVYDPAYFNEKGDNTIDDYKNRTEVYIDRIYDKLKNGNKKYIPLVSQSPEFNPYHKSLIRGIDRAPNIRYATGGKINFSESINSIISSIPEGVTKCASVNNCAGCTVVCNVLISATNEKQYSITNSSGNISTHTIGDVNNNTDTLTDEISNTIEVASTLTHTDSITQSDTDSKLLIIIIESFGVIGL